MTVSVICVADRPERLPLLLWSVVAQTYGDWEFILLDQSARGDVNRYIKQVPLWVHGRVRYLRVADNRDWGYAAKYSAAASLANGEALIFPQDDSYYVPTAFATMVESLKRGNDLALCGWLYDLFGYAPMPPNPQIGHVDIGGFMVRKSVFLETGWPNGSQTADGQFVEHMAATKKVGACEGVLYVRS
jgi:hypothetical protein